MAAREGLQSASINHPQHGNISVSVRAVTAALKPGVVWAMFKEAGSAWVGDNVPSLGAALAYYTVFSLAPVLIVVIAVAGLAFGQEAARDEIMRQIQALVGPAGAATIRTIIQRADQPALGIVASTVGLIAVVVGASGAFLQLQE